MCLYITILLLCLCVSCLTVPNPGEPSLRTLLLDEQNQDLIINLGTRYEVVHPVQLRQDWPRGLSTKVSEVNNTGVHIQQTTILIETYEQQLYLDLELNTNLFAPTLVQFLYLKGISPVAVDKLPENCYYHAKIRSHPEGSAAFQTCNGIKGVIYLGKKILFIHPLRGNNSANHPHLLYQYFHKEPFSCATENAAEATQNKENMNLPRAEKDAMLRNKYIETALVLDQALFEKYKLSQKDIVASAVEIINYVDLLYRPLNTSVSLVYLELWIENQMKMDPNIAETLKNFKDYVVRRIYRISVDAVHLLTSFDFGNENNGLAYLDSICTSNAVGLTRVENMFQPHVTSFVLAHMIGHNLGINHDYENCDCVADTGCIMGNDIPLLPLPFFSDCSADDYFKTLSKGYGACLFNMPTMRMSVCGNSILEEQEECDCGTMEECIKTNPCCDPMTCKLIKHAQCSSGPCCRKCKLLSPDHLCRPAKGECDIPEFCDGKYGQCPEDLYKKNGARCSDGQGYCFQGQCPVLSHQCQDIWGKDADSADMICFERLNILGTPNGNCGSDSRGEIRKCAVKDSYCGSLHCSQGEKTPVTMENPPIHFVVHKMNLQGVVHECKARTFSMLDIQQGLVKDGTKCGYKKLCLNQTCTNIRDIVTGKCPLEDHQMPCSGHGVCTNQNTCFCDEGWTGADCGIIDENSQWQDKDMMYYDSMESPESESPYYGHNEMKLNPNLAIIVTAAAIVIGVGLVIIVVLFFFYRHM